MTEYGLVPYAARELGKADREIEELRATLAAMEQSQMRYAEYMRAEVQSLVDELEQAKAKIEELQAHIRHEPSEGER